VTRNAIANCLIFNITRLTLGLVGGKSIGRGAGVAAIARELRYASFINEDAESAAMEVKGQAESARVVPRLPSL
jgi:hypothetical protein